jgi:hypothetical protein
MSAPFFNPHLKALYRQKRSPNPKTGASFSISKILTLAHHHNVGRLGSLGTFGDFKLDLIAFVKNLEPLLLNGRKMDEDVISIISGNEPKPLLLIKPFYSTFGHHNSPPLLSGLK